MENVSTQFVVGDNDLTVIRTQDCTPILEYCKSMHNEGFHGSGDLKVAAEFPDIVVEQYLIDNNIEYRELLTNPEHIKRMCNDPALAGFRIWAGKV